MIASDIGTVQLKDAFGYGRKQGGGDTRSMWSRRTAGTRCRSFRRDCFQGPRHSSSCNEVRLWRWSANGERCDKRGCVLSEV